jgi:hypothetical protein
MIIVPGAELANSVLFYVLALILFCTEASAELKEIILHLWRFNCARKFRPKPLNPRVGTHSPQPASS